MPVYSCPDCGNENVEAHTVPGKYSDVLLGVCCRKCGHGHKARNKDSQKSEQSVAKPKLHHQITLIAFVLFFIWLVYIALT